MFRLLDQQERLFVISFSIFLALCIVTGLISILLPNTQKKSNFYYQQAQFVQSQMNQKPDRAKLLILSENQTYLSLAFNPYALQSWSLLSGLANEQGNSSKASKADQFYRKLSGDKLQDSDASFDIALLNVDF
ncbi:MAG: hypothetical protein AAF988_07350 [Pseudomonadota bacterium]